MKPSLARKREMRDRNDMAEKNVDKFFLPMPVEVVTLLARAKRQKRRFD